MVGCEVRGVMQRSVLADVATTGHSLENINNFDEYCAMIEMSQDIIERVCDL